MGGIEKARHAEVAEYEEDWRVCRVVLSGRESKLKGADFRERAIPKLAGHRAEGVPASVYDSYVKRADYYPAAHRTYTGLRGLLGRKDVQIAASPESLADPGAPLGRFLSDVTGAGEDIQAFARLVHDELLKVLRCGVLVDFTAGTAPDMTPAQLEAAGIVRRPTWTLYPAEAIRDWAHIAIGSERVLSMVTLREATSAPDPDNKYSTLPLGRFRRLELTRAENGSYVYQQLVFTELLDEKGRPSGKYPEAPQVRTPRMGRNGETMSRIPFVIAPSWDVRTPFLLALCDKNLSHLRTGAGSENAQKLAGSPTPVFAGEGVAARNTQRDGTPARALKPIVLGGDAAIEFLGPATWGILTVGGDAIAALEAVLERKAREMIVLGAKVLESEERPAESGVAKEIDDDRDGSQLATLATDTSKLLTDALAWTLRWLLLEGSVVATSNRDFFSRPMSMDDMLSWVHLVQQGFAAGSDYVRAAVKGERFPPGRTWEDIQLDNASAPPPGIGTGTEGER